MILYVQILIAVLRLVVMRLEDRKLHVNTDSVKSVGLVIEN